MCQMRHDHNSVDPHISHVVHRPAPPALLSHPNPWDQNLHFKVVPGDSVAHWTLLKSTSEAAFHFILPHWPMRERFTFLSNVYRKMSYETGAAVIPSWLNTVIPYYSPPSQKLFYMNRQFYKVYGLFHLAFRKVYCSWLLFYAWR